MQKILRFLTIVVITLITTVSALTPNFAQNLRDDIAALIESECSSLKKLYYYFHAHPELSFYEQNTSTRLAKELRDIGFEVSLNIGGFGIVGILKNGDGPTVLVRTDMDALPLKEQTGLPYASNVLVKNDIGKEVGVMHACGHDVHMTVFIGTARLLTQIKETWKGTLIMVGQPAEEKGAGAQAMLNAGIFKRFPIPDYCLALHVAADLPAGKVGYCKGYSMANVDTVDITIYGVGGHGASPHLTKDPVVIAAQVILALQTIVSREIKPTESAVITVGSIHSGTTHNIVPDKANLQLTVRSYSDEVRNQLITSIKRITKGIAQAAGIPEDKMPTITIKDNHTASLYNDPTLTERLANIFQATLGENNVVSREPEMIGEDFAFFGRTKHKIPICMFRLGAIKEENDGKRMQTQESLPSLHSPAFAPIVEQTIKTGVNAMTTAVLELMKRNKKVVKPE